MPEQKLDKQLWREIQKKASGSECQRMDAIRLLFDKKVELSEESTRLIQRLASKDQPVAVRRVIAERLCASRDLPASSFFKILDALRNDPDAQVKSTTDEIYKKWMEPIAEFSKRFEATLQSITIPRIDLSKLSAPIPQIDVSKIKVNLPDLTNLSAKIVMDPMIWSSRVFESIARSAQVALPSYYPQPELERIGTVQPRVKKSRATRLRSRLAGCMSGKAYWKAYQDVCREILRYALVPPLFEPSEQTETRDRSQRKDLVFHIPYDGVSNFWEGMRITYKSLAMIVECKNYADLLPPNQVTITSKYFGEKRLGLFGVIVCRKGLSESAALEQTRLWMEDEKMIVVFTDRDMTNMLTLKEANDDPAKVIDNAIRVLRQSI